MTVFANVAPAATSEQSRSGVNHASAAPVASAAMLAVADL